MKVIRPMLVSLVLALAIVVLPAPPAHAIDTYAESQCSAGGFTGYLQVHYSYSPGSGYVTVRYYSYRINKGTNSGGNEANVDVWDHGIMPSRTYGIDNGIQDNRYRTLWDPVNYNRPSSEYFAFSFVFDKSWAPDPSCSKSFRIPSTY